MAAELVQAAAETAKSASGVDLSTTIAAIAGTVMAVIAAAFPIMKIVERWGATRAVTSKDGAESALYVALKEQIENHAKQITALQSEKSAWLQEQATLRSRVERLEGTDTLNTALKTKLDAKDFQIAELVNEIVRKNSEIADLRERVHHLEMRLARDEREWCKDCQFKRGVQIKPGAGR